MINNDEDFAICCAIMAAMCPYLTRVQVVMSVTRMWEYDFVGEYSKWDLIY